MTAQIIAQQPLKELNSLNADDYARQHNIARHNDNMDPLYSNYDIMNYAKNDPNSILYPNVDWADKYLKDIRWSQRYNLNIQGGTEAFNPSVMKERSCESFVRKEPYNCLSWK